MEIVDGFRADSGAKMVMVEAEAWGKLLLVINVNDHQIKTDDSHVLAPVPLFDLLPPASSPLPFAPPHVLLVQMPDFDALEARFLAAFGTSLEAHRAGSTTGQPHDLPPLDRDSFKNIWIPEMENDFTTLLIPEVDWIYVGMFYLPEGIIKTAVKRTREVRTQSGGDWTWADYQSAVMGAIGSSRSTSGSMLYFNALEGGFMSSFGVSLEENRVGSTMGKPQGLPSLDREAFTNIWIPEMENDFTKLEIPYADWVYGGMLYLPEGIVKTVVKQTRDEIRKGTGAEWTWDDYKFAVLAAIGSSILIFLWLFSKSCAFNI